MVRNEEKEYKDLFSSMEPEQPSMRFTKNVMEAIDGVEVAKPSEKYVSNSVIRILFAIPVISVAFICIYILRNAIPANDYIPGIKNIALLSAGALLANLFLIFILVDELAHRKRRMQFLSDLNRTGL